MSFVHRLRSKSKKRGRKEAQQGSAEDQSLISTSLSPVPTSTISTTPRELPAPFQDAGPTDPQTRDHPALTTPVIRPSTQPTIFPDLWRLAFEKFREEEPKLVPDYDKYVLSNTTGGADLSNRESVEAAVKMLLEDRETKQWKIHLLGKVIKVRTQVERLIKILQWSDPIVKDAVSTQPYAALAWSGVSLLLPLLTSATTQHEAMLDGYNSIGELQKFWKSCLESPLQSESQHHYQALKNPLVDLYSLFFAYQAQVISDLSKPQFARAWKDLSSPQFWSSQLDKINKLSESCCKTFGVSRDREAQESRDRQVHELQKIEAIQEKILQNDEEARRDEKEIRLLQDLAVAAGDYERYKNLNPPRVPGTCEWFLTDERFCKLRDSASSNLLWVSAGPGCGKSVLSKTLIDERQLDITTITIEPSSEEVSRSSQSTVCYFFFKEGGEGNTDSAHALCGLLHQLFTWPSTSGLIKYALPRHRDQGKTLTSKFSELWRILLDCIMSPNAGEIICVLDALDECKEESRQDFITALNDFYSQSESPSTASSTLKFLVTSRPYADLEQSFQKFQTATAYLRFEGEEKSEQIRQEIDLVIDARLPDFTRGFTTQDRQSISERLKCMDHRTYLWLHLTLDIIAKSPVDFGKRSDIEKLLSHLPSQVSDAYEKILNQSKDQYRMKILIEIMLAATRPLSLVEANVALTMASQQQELKSHAEIKSDMWPSDSFKSFVTNLCGLFVSVYDSKLSFIHQTAREFLIDPKPEGNWKGCFNMPQSHGTMSRICLRYLMLPDIDVTSADDPAKDEQYPYLAYTSESWPSHFISQDAANADALRKYARILCDTTKRYVGIWTSIYRAYQERIRADWLLPNESDLTDLILATYFGLSEVVQDILVIEKPEIPSVERDVSLISASKDGHVKIVQMLLDYGADANTDVGEDLTALCVASEGGAVVQLLLDKGADVNAADSNGETALHLASRTGGHVEIVQILLDKGADVNAADKNGWTALRRACGRGSVELVQLLLANGADVNKASTIGDTALHWASGHGYIEIVQLLLEKGADMNKTDILGRTALGKAIFKRHVKVVQLLRDRGADEGVNYITFSRAS